MLKQLLVSTAAGGVARMIVEHTDKDDYWGDGGVHSWVPGMSGNNLGQLLVRIREEVCLRPRQTYAGTQPRVLPRIHS